MGPSGSGKTTLLSLILCFHRPTAGEIYFDNKPATSVDRKSLRRHIGYVPQSQLLLSGTMMENLCFGNPGTSKQQVIKTAKVANLHEFIESLPEGYQTRIGERGVYLSEGQKQRISIARALVRDPEILLLDEPTSAMDIELENAVSNDLCFFAQDKTLIVVTHRLPIIKNVDRVFLLDNHGLK
jgi:ABC-type bacteriocin/lantibiotic exporter with double-glycine peptidase domain